MEQENRTCTHCQKRHERIVVRLANRRRTPQEKGKQAKNRRTPDKAELFTKHAEDKVRMFFGQERKIRLGTVAKALAANTATSDSRQRL